MKVAKTAARVVGIIGMVITPFNPGLGAILTAASAIATTALEAMSPSRPKGSAVGSQTDVRLDPQAGVPYVVGRTYYAGTLVHQDTFGTDNKFIGSVIVYSGGGPIQAFESFQVDRAAVSFGGAGGAATGTYAGFAWLSSQTGATPEAAALASSQGTLPGWDAASKLSGYAAALWTLKFDKNGKQWAGGYPQIGVVIQGVKAYDPRLDSTYPGGSGAHRSNDESTWAYTQNPWLHALTWAIGRHQNGGKRVLGVGMPIDGIDVANFVDAANVAGTNSWTVGGVVSSSDDKWDVLKMMCQAGGGQPVRLGGELSCDFETSRVSLATVTSADLIGEGKVVGTQRRRDRYNTAIPRCRLETHGWEVAALDQITVSSYVTEDGDTRTREIDLPLVQGKDQAAQLATYDLVSSREFGPITLPLKTKWLGYKPGDCLTLTVPELGLSAQKAVIIARELNPESGVVTLTLKSETDSKHAFALGKTGTAPTTPSLAPTDLATVAAPGSGVWTLVGTSVSGTSGSLPALQVTGAVDNVNAETVQFEVRLSGEGDGAWRIAGQGGPETVKRLITDSIAPGTAYEVAVSNIVRGVTGARRVLGPATAGTLGVDYSAVSGSTRPENNADVTRTPSGPAELVLQYNSDGTIKANETPKLASYYLTPAGGAAYTTGVTWSVATVTGSWSGTAPSISGSGTGQLSINSGPAGSEAVVNVTATYGGKAYPPAAVKIVKNIAIAAQAGGGGTLATDTSLASISSTTYAAVSDVLTVTTGPSATTVALTAALIELSPAGTYSGSLSWNVDMKWQRETSPGTWADIGIADASNPDPQFITNEPVAGEITCNETETGLSSSTAYKFRLVAKLTTGTQITNVNGTASAQG